jgi:hypothetical protein
MRRGRRSPASYQLVGAEKITHVADGLDALGARSEVAELAAQAVDAAIDRAVGAVVVEAAKLLQDVVAGEDLARVAREQPEHVELRRGELDGLAGHAHFTRGIVDLELAEGERVGDRTRALAHAGAAQHRPDVGEQHRAAGSAWG